MSDLEGVLVVALEQAVAAPFASSRLADAGARVIKIERPEGDFAREYDHLVEGESAYFVWLNRGKESVRLDLKREDDLALVESMTAKADVFIQNLAPGAAARLGFSAEALTRAFPPHLLLGLRLRRGRHYRDHKAYDLLIQGESGLLAINGSPEEPARRRNFGLRHRRRRHRLRRDPASALRTGAHRQGAARSRCRCSTRSPTG